MLACVSGKGLAIIYLRLLVPYLPQYLQVWAESPSWAVSALIQWLYGGQRPEGGPGCECCPCCGLHVVVALRAMRNEKGLW